MSYSRVAFTAVKSDRHSLTADNLACRRYERHKTCITANHRDQTHCIVEKIFGVESLELSDHVGVHAAGNLSFLDELIGFRETEILFDSVASVEERSFV